LDRETEELKHEKITHDVGKAIMQARQAKGWSQKELATVRISFCASSPHFLSVITNLIFCLTENQ